MSETTIALMLFGALVLATLIIVAVRASKKKAARNAKFLEAFERIRSAGEVVQIMTMPVTGLISIGNVNQARIQMGRMVEAALKYRKPLEDLTEDERKAFFERLEQAYEKNKAEIDLMNAEVVAAIATERARVR